MHRSRERRSSKDEHPSFTDHDGAISSSMTLPRDSLCCESRMHSAHVCVTSATKRMQGWIYAQIFTTPALSGVTGRTHSDLAHTTKRN